MFEQCSVRFALPVGAFRLVFQVAAQFFQAGFRLGQLVVRAVASEGGDFVLRVHPPPVRLLLHPEHVALRLVTVLDRLHGGLVRHSRPACAVDLRFLLAVDLVELRREGI